jgi:superfamily II DNA or RNA helicase
MSYPEIDDPDFLTKLVSKYEFFSNRISNKKPHLFLEPNQILVGNYLSDITPYNNLLLFYATGVGKSIAAVNILSQHPTKHIVILVKNQLIENNFKEQLEKFKQEMNDTTSYDIEFINYGSFVNRVIGQKENIVTVVNGKPVTTTKHIIKNPLSTFNNTVVIVDEAHNIINTEAYIALHRHLSRSKNYILALLTATPVFDNIREIFEISNLLNIHETQLPIRDNLAKSDLVSKSGDNSVFSNNILKITKKGKQTLQKTLTGKVSYLATDITTFPTVIEKGTQFGPIKLVKCPMSPFQIQSYNKAFSLDTGSATISVTNKQSSLFKNASDAATIVYPNGNFGSPGFSNTKDWSFLKHETLPQFSSKLSKLLDNIEKSSGTVFIYTEFVTAGGIELLKKLFLQNNIQSVRFLEGQTSESARKSTLNTFNHINNKNGDNIKILVGSKILSEGITLKRVQQVHILEPAWNMSRIQQIIGRAIRNRSHDGLPKSDQFVEIYKYAATTTNAKTIDEMKYSLASQKDTSNKEIEHLLKKIAIDCPLHLSRNTLPESFDNTRQCDYKKCNYKCKNFSVLPDQIDHSSLNIHFRKREITFIKQALSELFSHNNVLSLSDIFHKLSRFNLFTDNIYEALHDLVISDTPLQGPTISGSLNYVTHKNQSYYFLDNGNINSMFSFTGKKLVSPNKTIQNFIDSRNLNIPEDIPAQSLRAVTPSLTNQQQENNEYISSQPIFGKLKNKFDKHDNKFRIVDNRAKGSTKDKRKINLGKVCTFYDRNSLIDIAQDLDIAFPDTIDRTGLCTLIQNKLTIKNLVLH